MSAVWVTDGIERCRVGFLPRRRIGVDNVDGKLGQVFAFLALSDDKAERRRSHRNQGLVRVAMLGT